MLLLLFVRIEEANTCQDLWFGTDEKNKHELVGFCYPRLISGTHIIRQMHIHTDKQTHTDSE